MQCLMWEKRGRRQNSILHPWPGVPGPRDSVSGGLIASCATVVFKRHVRWFWQVWQPFLRMHALLHACTPTRTRMHTHTCIHNYSGLERVLSWKSGDLTLANEMILGKSSLFPKPHLEYEDFGLISLPRSFQLQKTLMLWTLQISHWPQTLICPSISSC